MEQISLRRDEPRIAPLQLTERNQSERVRAIHRKKCEYAPKPEAVPIFNFYMGKTTPERKDYIMERLVVPVEE